MRVFAASLATETNTFSPLPVGLSSFKKGIFYEAGQHPEEPSFFAGPLFAARHEARKSGWTLIEGLVAAALPAGITTRDAYETLRDQILAEIERALPLDMVVLGMHGAMVADGYDDCEGDMLERVRQIVGAGVAIGATLDPHGHISQRMFATADLLISWKEYPHTDSVPRAFELVQILAAKVEGGLTIEKAMIDCEMVTTIFTTQEPGKSLVARMHAAEDRNNVLSVSLNHGFPYGDVADMGTKVLVYTDGDEVLARTVAREFADEVIGLREALRIDYPEIDDALDLALASHVAPVIIADSADNPGGGAPGDTTYFLHRMLERGIEGAALGPIWDPLVVEMAFDCGVGARFSVRLGGKTCSLSGLPVDAVAVVKSLRRKHRMTGLSEGELLDCGDAALLELNGIEVVVCTTRVQAIGTDLFSDLGCDLPGKKIVVVKSSQHFYAHFSKISSHVLYANARGVLALDLNTLDYRKIRRPKWPLSVK